MLRAGMRCAICFSALLIWSLPSQALIAFPGAEGFGANAIGGRYGDVYHVTSLADTYVPGTLRYGVYSAPSAGRTIVFDISGTINMAQYLSIARDKVTIAGQTAPGDGITMAGYGVYIDANDVILRDMRFRLGTANNQEADTLGINNGSNIIVDHCSASWSVDETLSVAGTARNVTVQWTTISESLDHSIHSKGAHGYGSLIRPDVDASYTFHHNLYAHNRSRNPRPGTYNGKLLQFDFRNNVVYDWGQAGYGAYDGEYVNMNYVGNYLVAGQSTKPENLGDAFAGGSVDTHIYQSGNMIDSDRDGNHDGVDTGWGMITDTYTKVLSPYNYASVATDTADVAYTRVLGDVGARPWARDPVDLRIINDVKNETGHVIDATSEVGGFPTLASILRPTDFDTDLDGMPNFWETLYGTNPSLADNSGDRDGDGYTNLEAYLAYAAVPEPVTMSLLILGGTMLLRRRNSRQI
jgi:pectate lyase